MRSKEKIGIIIVLFCGIMWGLSGVLGQMLFENSDVTVGWLTSIRMFISGSVILIYLCVKEGKKAFSLWIKKENIVSFLIFTLFGLTAVQYTYFAAVNASNAATATVLQYTYPVLILLYTAICSKKMPQFHEGISIFLAFLGVILIATHGNLSSLSISALALFLGLLSAFSFVFYTVYPKRLYEKEGLLQVMAWAFIIGGIILFVGTKSYSANINLNTYSLGLTFAITIFGTMIPFVIYGKGVEWLGNVRASLFVTVEPIFSAILAVILLNTSFKAIDIIGFICIIAGVELVAIKTLKESRKKVII